MRALPRALPSLLLGLLAFAATAARAADPTAPPADAATGKITALLDAGRYDEALAAARERLSAVEAASGSDAPEAARAIDLVLEAGYWSSRPKDPDLLALARRAVAIDERTSGPDSPVTAESLAGLASILIARGEDDEARGLCVRSLAIEEKAFGPGSARAAASHRCLGVVLENQGDIQGALVEDQRALEIQEKALPPDDREIGVTLNSLASVQRQLGDYPRAVASRERCLAIREKAFGPDNPQVAWAIHNLANLHADLGEFEKAKALYERALAIREKVLPADHPDLGYSHNSLGIVAYGLGDYAAARTEYERALAIREKALGPDHALVGATLNNLGNLLDEMGEPEEARDFLARALEIKSRKLGADHVSTATTANNLGNVLAELGEFDRAEELTRRGLAAREKTLGDDHADVGRSLDDLGWLRHLRGDPASGLPFLERALAVREKALGGDHPDVASTLERLAIVKSEAGDPAAALPLAARALESRRRILGPDHPSVAGTLALAGTLQLRLGRAPEALASALESERIGREHFRRTARHLSQREALRYEQVRASGLEVALAALVAAPPDPNAGGRAEAVLDGLIRSRALVLDAIASRRRLAAESRPEGSGRRLEALNEAATALARLARREPDPDHPERFAAQLREAREKEERAERDLIEISPAERTWSEAGQIGLAEVRRALPDRAALLSYVRVTTPERDIYVAFVTTGGSGASTAAIPLGSASMIGKLAARWREEAARGARGPSVTLRRLESEYRAAGSDLREAIWDPVAPRLKGAPRVFVVPDGALDVVSLETLPSRKSGYMIETGPPLLYLSAERDLVEASRPRETGAGLLVVGGVEYGPAAPAEPAGAPCSPFRSLSFAPLAAAGEEANGVAGLWRARAERAAGTATELTGANARAPDFLRAAPGKRVLHIATHGFFLADTCPNSGSGPADPMLLSGLAFAGANQRRSEKPLPDDGLLTAGEIASMDLRGVEWAVLSACDTGVGEIRSGEGVLGLRRAFEIAGVETLIMSLWPVRDEDAKAWMGELYEARFSGAGTSEAVRRAGLKVIEARRKAGRDTHPASWGAFVAYGAWR